MRKLYSCAATALFLLTAIQTAGCSSAAPAAGPDTGESSWTPVLECKISRSMFIAGFLNENYGVSLGVNGDISYSGDGGKTWSESENGYRCLCLDIIDENTVWCGGSARGVYTSKDGARTWIAATKLNLIKDHSNIDFIDGDIGWVATSSHLAGTSDGGATWTKIPLPEGADGVAALCLRTPEDGGILSRDGMLHVTADGGATWSSRDLGFKNYDIIDLQKQPRLSISNLTLADISFTDELNGTIVFIGRAAAGPGDHTWCLTTSDGGTAWESELIPETEFTPSRVFISGDGQYLTLSDASNNAVVWKRKA
jgi:photosystem II stability/assembly factor-like uncharacterized protein